MSEQYGAVGTHSGCALSFAPLVFTVSSSDLAINSENCKLAHQMQQRKQFWEECVELQLRRHHDMELQIHECDSIYLSGNITSNFGQISWRLAWLRTRTLSSEVSFVSFPPSKGMPVDNCSPTWRAGYRNKIKQEQLCSEPSQLSTNYLQLLSHQLKIQSFWKGWLPMTENKLLATN